MTKTKTVEDFLKIVEPYTKSKTTSGDSIGIILKDEVVSDPDTLIELQIEAKKVGAKCTTMPPGFRVPLVTKVGHSDITTELLFLHESDIEDGGPQPRLEIRPDDPETVALFESIKPKDGGRHNAFGVNQRDPIDTYPSPLNNGKYRICEGHRRRMVIFNMLRLDGIWAFNKKRTEQEAFEDALILNTKKGLSSYELALFMLKLREKFPNAYPTQEALGKRLGLSHDSISIILKAHAEIEKQKDKLPPDLSNRFEKLPASKINELQKAPEQAKTVIISKAIEKDLSRREITSLVKDVTDAPNVDDATIEAAVNKIVEERTINIQVGKSDEEKASEFLAEGDKLQRKNDRAIDKLIAQFKAYYPEKLITAVYGSFGDAKVTPEKFQSTMHTVIGIMLTHSDLDAVLLEASKWK
jgi:hypothetical protein